MYVSRACLVIVALILAILAIVLGCRMEVAASGATLVAPPVVRMGVQPPVDSLSIERVYSPSQCNALDGQAADATAMV